MRTSARTVLAGATLAAGALGAYAVLVEPRWLQVTRPRIHLRGLPPALEGLRIALLSDFHAGTPRADVLVRRACRLAMAERPDLIVLTGDLAGDDAQGYDGILDAVAGLRAPLGVYAVPGNHDHEIGIEKWLRQVGSDPVVEDLTNRAVVKEVEGVRLCIAGVDDFSRGSPSLRALPPPAERDLTLLLAHDPDQAERARRDEDRVDLVLSGHTHGGQVRLPWVGAIVNPARRDDLYEEGLRRRPWTQVYISRGIGTSQMSVRFLCRPEVAVLELTGDTRPPRAGRTR